METTLRSIPLPPQHSFASPWRERPQWAVQRVNDPRNNRLLAALSETAFQRLLPDLKPMEMPLGMVLGEPGQTQTDVYFPTTSIVALMYDMEDGRTGAVSVCGNEGVIGIATFMGGGGTLGRQAVVCAGRGFRMRAADLRANFDVVGPVTELLLRYIQAMITQLAQTVVCNRCHTIENRLSRFLLTTLDRLDGRPDFVMTHELIAGVLGVRREGITEAALNLQRAGLLRYKRGHIHMLDRAGLEHLSCECYGVVANEYVRLLPVCCRSPLN